MKFANTAEMRERRIRNALWGLFIGDALGNARALVLQPE
jgi:ADP-ribosyl-[dinitrogen reductase] hydrolase